MPEGVGYAFHDLGEKTEYPEAEAAPASPPEKRYPSIYSISEEQLPELDLYEVGDDVLLIIKAKITRKEQMERDGEDKRVDYGLELREGIVQDAGVFKKMRETGMSKEQVERAK